MERIAPTRTSVTSAPFLANSRWPHPYAQYGGELTSFAGTNSAGAARWPLSTVAAPEISPKYDARFRPTNQKLFPCAPARGRWIRAGISSARIWRSSARRLRNGGAEVPAGRLGSG